MPKNSDSKKGFKPKSKKDDSDSSSVDSKGNIKGLIDYDYDSEDSDYITETTSSSKSPIARRTRGYMKKKNEVIVKKPKKNKDDEDERDKAISNLRDEIKSFKKLLKEKEEDEHLTKLEEKLEKKRRLRKKGVVEESSEDEEDESDEETEEDEEGDVEEDEEGDESDEETEEDEDEDEDKPNGIVLSFGVEDGSNDRMIPKRHNMKKESSEVKKFVKLITTPSDEDTIDGQIDQFKALTVEQRNKLINVLETKNKSPSAQQGLMFKILTMNLPTDIQSMVLSKYNSLQTLDPGTSEYFKQRNWLEKFTSIPLGIYKELPVKISDGSETCSAFMEKARKSLDEAIYGQEEAKLQILQFIGTKIANPDGRGLSLLLSGPPGIGKCHAKDTPILMADGSIKLVQNIEVGDLIMGDDSTPRKVLSLGRGKDTMYDIIPVKGEKYRVNSEHILCLKQSGIGHIKPIIYNDTITYKTIRFNNKDNKLSYKSFKTYENAEDYLNSFTEEDNIIEISVKDYLALPKEIKDRWLKGYRKGVEFPYIEPDFDPYIIGLWLGDGASSKPVITSQDAEIITYLQKTLPQYNLMLTYYSKYDYNIRAITTGKTDNIFLETLYKYNMLNNKHIPSHYKCNSRDVRLKLLAGLVDTDGYVNFGTIEITQKSKQLSDDILYLARSLGFAAYSREKCGTWTYNGIKKSGNYYCITISGNILEIPIRIKRKIPEIRLQKKDVLVSGITIKESGYDDYYGFTLDGNHRYLMGDFTVTHNTSLIKNGVAKAIQWPFQFISLGGDSDASTYTGHQLVYESSHCGKIVNSLCAAKSMSLVLMFDEVDKISTTPKGEEVQNLLVHLTDPVQNSEFEDKYLAGIPIDLSKVMFTFSANYLDRIDKVLLDRMNIVHLQGYNLKEKVAIAENYLIPSAFKEVGLSEKVGISKEVVTYVVENYANEEVGVRELKRCIEQIAQKVNMLRMFNSKDLPFYIKDFSLPFVLKKEHIDLFLKKKEKNISALHMYA